MKQQIWSELKQNWFQLRVPVPFSLRYVNSYILGDSNGQYTVIDPGLKTSESIAVWEQALNELHIGWQQITQIIVTHQHPDHYGLAGLFQQKSGAVVYMTEEAYRYTQKLWGAGEQQFEVNMRELLQQHGAPAQVVNDVLDNLREFLPRVEPQPQVTYIKETERLSISGLKWDCIPTKGHAYGQIMLYQPQLKWMFCADQVLPRITPHVGVVAGEERSPLFDFLENMNDIRIYDVLLALPGHREPFTNYNERIQQILEHHERRLQKMVDYIKQQQSKLSAFVICEYLFGTTLRTQPHNMRFAMTETIAHLDELVRRGLLKIVFHNSAQFYEII